MKFLGNEMRKPIDLHELSTIFLFFIIGSDFFDFLRIFLGYDMTSLISL